MIFTTMALYEGSNDVQLHLYLQPSQYDYQSVPQRPAVLILPGGGFMSHFESEGTPVALQFLAKGYQVFVLHYAIGMGAGLLPAPILDAAKAIATLRQNAGRWHVDPSRIYTLGFSTGAYLAAALGAHWHRDLLTKPLNLKAADIEPNGQILCYPLLSLSHFWDRSVARGDQALLSAQMLFEVILGTANPPPETLIQWDIVSAVTPNFPRTFMWGQANDPLWSAQDLLGLAQKLESIRDNRGYALHLYQAPKSEADWFEKAIEWLT